MWSIGLQKSTADLRRSNYPQITQITQIIVRIISEVSRCGQWAMRGSPIASHFQGNAENADIAASAGSGKRQTPNAFLSPPTSGTLFDVLFTNHFLPLAPNTRPKICVIGEICG
jgi:hypothetical protein